MNNDNNDNEALPENLSGDVLAQLDRLADISTAIDLLDRDLEESHKRRLAQIEAIGARVDADARSIDEQLDELERDEALASDILDEVAMNEATVLARMEEEDEAEEKAKAAESAA